MAASAGTLASFAVNPGQPNQIAAQQNNGLQQENLTQGTALPQDTVTLSPAALAQAQTQPLAPAADPANTQAQTQTQTQTQGGNGGAVASVANAPAANIGTIAAPAGPGTNAPAAANPGGGPPPAANAAPAANVAPAANTGQAANTATGTNAPGANAAAPAATQAGGTTATSQQEELAQLAVLLQQLGINPASVSSAEQIQLLAYMNDPAALAQFVNGGVVNVQANNANNLTQPQNAGAASQVQGLNVLA